MQVSRRWPRTLQLAAPPQQLQLQPQLEDRLSFSGIRIRTRMRCITIMVVVVVAERIPWYPVFL